MLFHRHAKHFGSGAAVNVAALSKDVQHPVFASQPRDNAGFNRGKVAHVESVARCGYKGRTDQFTKYVGRVAVVIGKFFQIAALYQAAGVVQAGQVVLRQVLHLHQATGPAASPGGAIKLQQAVYTSVVAYAFQHSRILLTAGFGHILAQLDKFLRVRVFGQLVFKIGQHLFV